MKKVSLITDGSCLGNPGPGGWACILRFGGVKKEFFGFDPHATNNRMELMASIQGLLALKEPSEVAITTDSEYVLHGITKNGSGGSGGKSMSPCATLTYGWNLDELASRNKTTWLRTRGHGDHKDNSRCDWLAQNAAATQSSCWADGRPHAPFV